MINAKKHFQKINQRSKGLSESEINRRIWLISPESKSDLKVERILTLFLVT